MFFEFVTKNEFVNLCFKRKFFLREEELNAWIVLADFVFERFRRKF